MTTKVGDSLRTASAKNRVGASTSKELAQNGRGIERAAQSQASSCVNRRASALLRLDGAEMYIAIFGVNGRVGSRIAQEALSRGCSVTGVYHHSGETPLDREKLLLRHGNVTDPHEVAQLAKGNDAVVSAIGPSESSVREFLPNSVRSLLVGLKQANVRRLVVVGGAGSLEVTPGVQLVDTPDFPPAWREVALAHREALDILKQEREIDWTYISPAAFLEPGERRGHYRVDSDKLVVDAEGQSRISMEDYAVAVLDELERGQFLKKRMAVGW
ncbi:MAG TPA: NAD(P)-dependent oxidoreductase [Bryobacteraceae bacterium]|nr:NAD(P)-dependent oxidoreductase [Bryobacteraceae bacterium]